MEDIYKMTRKVREANPKHSRTHAFDKLNIYVIYKNKNGIELIKHILDNYGTLYRVGISCTTNCFKSDVNIITNQKEISHRFIVYYSEVGTELATIIVRNQKSSTEPTNQQQYRSKSIFIE